MTILELVITLLGSAGFLAGVAAIVKVVLDYRRGVQTQEVDAETRHITRLEATIESLEENKIARDNAYLDLRDQYSILFQDKAATDRYNTILITHIIEDKGPPPPSKP